jgi:hypothetical protein
MAALAGPFLAVAGLLGAGGATKVHRPAPTARALGQMRLPGSAALVRAGAAAEVALAGAAVAWATRPLVALVALSYLGFAGFVLVALRRDVPLSTCGCFGVPDTPPTYGHLALNLAAAAVAAAAALGPDGMGLAAIARMDGSFVLRGVFVVLTVTTVWFAYAALTVVPRALAAVAARGGAAP